MRISNIILIYIKQIILIIFGKKIGQYNLAYPYVCQDPCNCWDHHMLSYFRRDCSECIHSLLEVRYQGSRHQHPQTVQKNVCVF